MQTSYSYKDTIPPQCGGYESGYESGYSSDDDDAILPLPVHGGGGRPTFGQGHC